MAKITWINFVFLSVCILQTTIFAAEIPSTIATQPNATISTDNSDTKANKTNANDVLTQTNSLNNEENQGSQQPSEIQPTLTNTININSDNGNNNANSTNNNDQSLISNPKSTNYDNDTLTVEEANEFEHKSQENATNLELSSSEAEDMTKQDNNSQDLLNLENAPETLDNAQDGFKNGTFGLPENADLKTVTKEDDVAESQSGNNEDDREVIPNPLIGQKIFVDDADMPQKSAVSQLPVIIASLFVILCMVGYSAMLMWRRFLERKYGNREMLINEDFDPNDMRHFSI